MLKQCKECGGALTYGKYCSTKGCPNEGNNDMSKMSNLDVETREFKADYGNWISAEEKLPEIGSPVLIFDGDEIAVAHLNEYNYWFVHQSYGINEDGQIPKVYFWMYLPSKPSL